ncbi:D-glycero-alpha-D-manno-heptose-1,7-bisphosphate 7-phosphatase, partial [Desulfovibrio sp. 1214_IL3152]
MTEKTALRRAIFLDRDGTLNRDTGYVHRKEDWQWLPGVPEALKRLRAVGYVLVVVSNQSGIARGMFDHDALKRLEEWINADLAAKNAAIDAWYYCPHLPEITGPCQCRKPEPGLILQAARDLHIDLADSWMIGDRVR